MVLALETGHVVVDETTGERSLSVVVRNTGDEALHVITGGAGLSYDESEGVLSVAWAGPDPSQAPPQIDIVSFHPFTPPQRVLAPGETLVLSVAVPNVVHTFRPAGGLSGLGGAGVTVDEIKQVQATVEYKATPFQPVRGAASPTETWRQARIGAAAAHARLKVSSRPPDPNPGPTAS